MCNRIWAFAPFVAFALKHRLRLIVPFFGEYAADYPQIGALARVQFACSATPLYLRVVRRIFRSLRLLPPRFRSLMRIRIAENWGHEDWDEATLTAPFSAVFLSGWAHPPPVSDLRPWRDELRHILLPSRSICQKVEDALAAGRRRCPQVVGIHLRREDYRDWAEGRYYFTNAQYAVLMAQIRAQMAGPTAFLLCSNEAIDTSDFPEFDVLTVPGASGVEDLHALSLCDFIAGPPSTYSMWASFYGDVPLYIVEDIDRPVTRADFSAIVALNRFADGRTFSLPISADDDTDRWFRSE